MTERENDVLYSSDTDELTADGRRTYLFSYYVTKVFFILSGASCSMYAYSLLLGLIPNETVQAVADVLAWMHVALQVMFTMISLPSGIMPLKSPIAEIRRKALIFDILNLLLLILTLISCYIFL